MGETRRPPGPRGSSWGGATIRWAKDPLGFVQDTARRYGDVARLRLGGAEVWLVSEPELVAEVGHQRRAFSGCAPGGPPPVPAAERLVPCLAADTGWARDPGLGVDAARLAGWAEAALEAAGDPGPLPSDGPVEVLGWARRLAGRAVIRGAVDASMDPENALRLGTALAAATELLEQELGGAGGLVPGFVPTGRRRSLGRLLAAADGILLEQIQSRRERPVEADDLLGRLLALRDAEGRGLTDERIRDEVVAFLVAALEPTSLGLAWSIYLAGLHGFGDRLRAERTLGAPPRAARGVALEALRLFPPSWLTCRLAVTDVPLGPWIVPRGAQVWISPWVLHRDPRRYRRPEAFEPERWAERPAPPAPAASPVEAVVAFVGEVTAGLLSAAWEDARFEPLPTTSVGLVPGLFLAPRRGLWMRAVGRTAEDLHAVRRLRVRLKIEGGAPDFDAGASTDAS